MARAAPVVQAEFGDRTARDWMLESVVRTQLFSRHLRPTVGAQGDRARTALSKLLARGPPTPTRFAHYGAATLAGRFWREQSRHFPAFQHPATAAHGRRSLSQRRGWRAARRAAPGTSPQAPGAGPNAYDVIILGSGPASLSLAALLASSSKAPPSVAVISREANKRWVPNYGSWTDEWETLSRLYSARGVSGLMERGVAISWDDTDCFFGEDSTGDPSTPEGNARRCLNRPYLRLSREGLKDVFYPNDATAYEVIKANAVGCVVNTNVFAPAGSVTMGPEWTDLTLDNGDKVRGKIIVDGTGAETGFTIRDGRQKEGYQIAYGVECRVTGQGVNDASIGDYDRQKMTLFDYRSEAWRASDTLDPEKVVNEPTFNYVMPLRDGVVFFEETSLVANPAVSFRECKKRLQARLASQGVQIADIIEEEFCYIPMGGKVPRQGQRIVPIGAAAGIVHPSTGYQVCRCLSSNLDVCEQILEELKASGDSFDPDLAAARILGRTWTPSAIRQRNFALFGGEFLMKQDVEGLKGFFSGFFKLDKQVWGGFLAGWKNLPGNEFHEDWFPRLRFGVQFLTCLPVSVAVNMARSILQYTLEDGPDLIQSVTPFFGEPAGSDELFRFRANKGDVAAKNEALGMMAASELEPGDAKADAA